MTTIETDFPIAIDVLPSQHANRRILEIRRIHEEDPNHQLICSTIIGEHTTEDDIYRTVSMGLRNFDISDYISDLDKDDFARTIAHLLSIMKVTTLAAK